MRRFLLFTLWSLAWISVQGQAASPQHQFPVFDTTNLAQEPDLWDSKEQSVQTELAWRSTSPPPLHLSP